MGRQWIIWNKSGKFEDNWKHNFCKVRVATTSGPPLLDEYVTTSFSFTVSLLLSLDLDLRWSSFAWSNAIPSSVTNTSIFCSTVPLWCSLWYHFTHFYFLHHPKPSHLCLGPFLAHPNFAVAWRLGSGSWVAFEIQQSRHKKLGDCCCKGHVVTSLHFVYITCGFLVILVLLIEYQQSA